MHPSVSGGRIWWRGPPNTNSFRSPVFVRYGRPRCYQAQLASGVCSHKVAFAAQNWLENQQEQAAARARGMTVHQHVLARQLTAAARSAAVCSFVTVALERCSRPDMVLFRMRHVSGGPFMATPDHRIWSLMNRTCTPRRNPRRLGSVGFCYKSPTWPPHRLKVTPTVKLHRV